MKLELKHLAHYLPYGLKVKLLREEYEGLYSEFSFRPYLDYPLGIKINNDTIYAAMLSEIKPILRPLSGLTKEIEHNGEKFVPIIRLANQNYYVNNGLTPIFDRCKTVNESNFLAYNSSTEISKCQFRFRTFGADGENSDLNFEFYDNTSYVVRNKHFSTLANINKLYEWHFDVYGLINAGLAIDINTI